MPYDAPDQPPVATPQDIADLEARLGGRIDTLAEQVASVPPPNPGTPSNVSPNGTRLLSSFAGGDDDSRLSAAIDWVKTQGVDGVKGIELDGGMRGPFKTGRLPVKGLKIVGARGMPTNQPKSGNPFPSGVKVIGDGGWWKTAPGVQVPDFALAYFSMNGQVPTGTTAGKLGNSLFESSAGADYQNAVFRDIGIANVRCGFGSPEQQALFTASTIDGWWNINNYSECAYCIGGSDSGFWVGQRPLLDSPTTIMKGKWHQRIAYLSKSIVGPAYHTAEGPAGALRVTGNDDVWDLEILSQVIEGRNKNAPNTAPVMISHEGGEAWYHGGCWNFSKGIAVFQCSGGRPFVESVCYGRGAGATYDYAETTPLFLVTGGELMVRTIRRGGAWKAGSRPLYKATGGTIDADSSVRAA